MELTMFLLLILYTFGVLFLICDARIGPKNSDKPECDEFSKFARFNPYSIVGEQWLIFYYWDDLIDTFMYKFSVPTKKVDEHLHSYLDGHTRKPVNWTASRILMQKVYNNETTLLVEQSDRGHYYHYKLHYDLKVGELTRVTELRFKQLGNNKYVAIMNCKTMAIWVMARMQDVPRKKDIQDAVASIGFRGDRGKSYLYQGHEWVPIPEADEWTLKYPNHFWARI